MQIQRKYISNGFPIAFTSFGEAAGQTIAFFRHAFLPGSALKEIIWEPSMRQQKWQPLFLSFSPYCLCFSWAGICPGFLQHSYPSSLRCVSHPPQQKVFCSHSWLKFARASEGKLLHTSCNFSCRYRAQKSLDPICGWSNGTWVWMSAASLKIHPQK